MADGKRGLWLIGARGGVATTVSVGLCELAADPGGSAALGLITDTPDFANADAVGWDQWVVGGHELRSGSLADAARELEGQNGAMPSGLADRHRERLVQIDNRIRSGVRYRSGATIDALSGGRIADASPRELIDQIKEDLVSFRTDNDLASVVVVLLSSTEPWIEEASLPADWATLQPTLASADDCPLRASSLYAIAAIESGMPLVNFTPSLGASCAAISQLAAERGVPIAGRDGKTGETLLKSVLAPMFAQRALRVDSWVGHNLLGNRDGAVLSDPANKQSKIATKDALLAQLLGYTPQSLVSIESIESLGDWKTAWDHVHFRGFLGVPMTLQFTWQGCDSALAAPLVLDLARLISLAESRGEAGPINAFAPFFKSPDGVTTHDFAMQFQHLSRWVKGECV